MRPTAFSGAPPKAVGLRALHFDITKKVPFMLLFSYETFGH